MLLTVTVTACSAGIVKSWKQSLICQCGNSTYSDLLLTSTTGRPILTCLKIKFFHPNNCISIPMSQITMKFVKFILLYSALTSSIFGQDDTPACLTEDTTFITGCLGPMIDISQTLAARNPRINRLVFPLFYFQPRDMIAVCETWADITRHCITPDLLQRCPAHGLYNLLEPLFGFACSERDGQRYFAQYNCINHVVLPIESCTQFILAPQDPNASHERCKTFPQYFACIKPAVETACGFQATDIITQAINYYGCPVSVAQPTAGESIGNHNAIPLQVTAQNFVSGNGVNQPQVVDENVGNQHSSNNFVPRTSTQNLPVRTIIPGTAQPSTFSQDPNRNDQMFSPESANIQSGIFRTQEFLTAESSSTQRLSSQPFGSTRAQAIDPTRSTSTTISRNDTSGSSIPVVSPRTTETTESSNASSTTTAKKSTPSSIDPLGATSSPPVTNQVTNFTDDRLVSPETQKTNLSIIPTDHGATQQQFFTANTTRKTTGQPTTVSTAAQMSTSHRVRMHTVGATETGTTTAQATTMTPTRKAIVSNTVETRNPTTEQAKCTSELQSKSHACLEPLIQLWFNRSLENPRLREMILGILVMKREHVLELCDHYASSFLDCQLETFYQCRDDDLVKFADRNFGYACGNAPVFFRKFDCLSVISKDNEECRKFLRLDPEANTEDQCDELWKFYFCVKPEVEQLCSDNTVDILKEAITYFGCSDSL